jgi:hypothetical protein
MVQPCAVSDSGIIREASTSFSPNLNSLTPLSSLTPNPSPKERGVITFKGLRARMFPRLYVPPRFDSCR